MMPNGLGTVFHQISIKIWRKTVEFCVLSLKCVKFPGHNTYAFVQSVVIVGKICRSVIVGRREIPIGVDVIESAFLPSHGLLQHLLAYIVALLDCEIQRCSTRRVLQVVVSPGP